jgi:hypothetical protein
MTTHCELSALHFYSPTTSPDWIYRQVFLNALRYDSLLKGRTINPSSRRSPGPRVSAQDVRIRTVTRRSFRVFSRSQDRSAARAMRNRRARVIDGDPRRNACGGLPRSTSAGADPTRTPRGPHADPTRNRSNPLTGPRFVTSVHSQATEPTGSPPLATEATR